MSDADKDHGHTKELTIIVNGRQKVISQKELSFDEVVQLAFPGSVPNNTTVYTITFKRGEGNKPEGTLVAGDTVKVKDGTVFNVTATDQS